MDIHVGGENETPMPMGDPLIQASMVSWHHTQMQARNTPVPGAATSENGVSGRVLAGLVGASACILLLI
jgi:hypothetical protein